MIRGVPVLYVPSGKDLANLELLQPCVVSYKFDNFFSRDFHVFFEAPQRDYPLHRMVVHSFSCFDL